MSQIEKIFNKKYYSDFQNNKKMICLTFYYNYILGDGNLFSNFTIPKSDPEKILLNLNILLDFYICHQFNCNLKINDNLWLTDLSNRDKIIDIFIQKFQNSLYKPKEIIINSNAIHCLEEKKDWFINLINKFNEINIQVKLNFETILIDIVDVRYLFDIQDFLLTYANKLTVKINPNNFVYFTEVFESLDTVFKPILFLFEEDNFNWTDYKINEYIEFLDFYIDRLYNQVDKNNIKFLELLFSNNKVNLISLNNNNNQNKCAFYSSVNILLEDFTINPCPKFQYNDLKIEEYQNIEFSPCHFCAFSVFCEGFCHKESFRRSLNLDIPIKESCEMKKAKYVFLFFKLKNLNIMTIENLNKISNINSLYLNDILNLYNQIIKRIEE